ncbi:MAG: CopG family transcriptional regulator [Armatimonadota bacterium]|nr:CopG family transcriptional regulator [Armatimonadota bacterium]
MLTAARVHQSLTEPVTVLMSAEMVAALDRVAQEAGRSRAEVIREYVAESLPDGWLRAHNSE